MKLHDGLRKAAILVASLDRRTADLLMDQMSSEQAHLVRQTILQMGKITPEDERQVLEEFFHRGPGPVAQPRAGIELTGSLAQKLAHATDALPGTHAGTGQATEGSPFEFLKEAEADKLGKLLIAERPQTIALVLSHLSPDRAGAVLVRLPAALQVEVIRRLIDLEETDPEVLHVVEQTLQTRLAELVRMQRRRVAGLSAVAGILQASDSRVGMQILENVNVHDRQLASKLGPERFEFDDLELLDDRSLTTLLSLSEPELAILALVGAPQELIERLLRQLPALEAQTVRHRLIHVGPTRLSDVEEARQQLVELARRLAIQGRIRLPQTHSSGPATAAAAYAAV
jgi:flagellar motor switch protein FliG